MADHYFSEARAIIDQKDRHLVGPRWVMKDGVLHKICQQGHHHPLSHYCNKEDPSQPHRCGGVHDAFRFAAEYYEKNRDQIAKGIDANG